MINGNSVMNTTTRVLPKKAVQNDEGVNTRQLANDARRERVQIFSLSWPSLLLVFVFLVLPVGWLFSLSFISDGELSLTNYTRMLEYSSYIEIYKTTFLISFLVTGLCILLGYPVAYLLAQLPSRLAMLGLVCVLLPFWTSILVRTYAWLVLLQRRGVVNDVLMALGITSEPIPLVYNFIGTTIGMLHIMLPFLVLPLYSAIKSIDGDVLRASSSLGASPVKTFFRVFLPLSLPGLFAGTVLVFVLCLGFYVTPQLLGGGRVIMVSMKIAQNINMYFDWGAASALGVVLLVIVGIIFYIAHRLLGLSRIFGGD